MQVTVDVDAIAKGEINKLKNELAKAERKITRLEKQVGEMKIRERQVREAWGAIATFVDRYGWIDPFVEELC